MKYEDIAIKIMQLRDADIALRHKLVRDGQLSDGYNEEMANLHNRNAAKLSAVIDEIGYPTIAKVGKDASEAAWLIIQHSIGQPDFMRKCARLLADAVDENEASPADLAYLSDRIAFLEGRPQLYGTQFDWDKSGELSPCVYDDLTKVNERRRSLGLNKLEVQTEILRKQAGLENQQPPADDDKRKQEFDEWKWAVGWLK